MPKRSTLFQRVVFQIQRQLADAAAVEESAMLPDHTGESEREVDVVIRSVVAGHDVIVSLECQEGSRKATVSWVEAMAMKHDALPTSKLILLSASGFTRGARSKAVSLGIELLSFEEAFESDWANLDLNALDLWALSVSGCVVGLVSTKVWFWAPEELDIFDGGGVSLGELGVIVRSAFERSIETSESAVEYAKKHDAAEFCIGCENHAPFFLKDQFGQLKLASLLYVRVKAVRAMSLFVAQDGAVQVVAHCICERPIVNWRDRAVACRSRIWCRHGSTVPNSAEQQSD